jgi:hypothetical protein
MKRPRVTVGRLMLAVIIAAEALTLVVRFPDWVDGRRRDFDLASIQFGRLGVVSNPFGHPAMGQPSPTRRGAYYRAMSAKYRWAAEHPWLPVWLDPPEPQE